MNCCDFPAQIASSGVNIPGLPPTVRLADLYVSYTLLTFSTRCCHGEPTSLTAWRCLGEGKKKKKRASPADFSYTHQHMCSYKHALLDSYRLDVKAWRGNAGFALRCKTHRYKTPPDGTIYPCDGAHLTEKKRHVSI